MVRASFKFDEASHTYTLDAIQIPSVTSVLPYNYNCDTEYQRDRGLKVHKAIELFNKGVLDEGSLDPVIASYLESYKFTPKPKGKNIIVDYKAGSPYPCTELQLAGYAELLRANRDRLPFREFHELKLYHPTYLYAGTIDYIRFEDADASIALYALYLQADGGMGIYVDYSKNLRKNISIFLSFLTTWKWRKEKGLL